MQNEISFKEPLKGSINKPSNESIILMIWLLNEVSLTVTRYVLTQLNIYGFGRSFLLFCVTMIPVTILLVLLQNIKVKNYLPFLLLYVVIVFCFLFTYLFHPEYSYFYTRESYGIVRVFRPDCALYAFLFFSLIDDPYELLKTVKNFAYIDMAYLFIFQLIPALIRGYWIDTNYQGIETHYVYNLSFGYSLLLPTIVFLYFFLKKKSYLHLLLAVVGLFFIFTQGSRGAMIIPIIFIGLMIISGVIDSKNVSYKIFKISAVITLLILLILFGNNMLIEIVSFFQSLGIQSRTLELFIQGEVTNDSGRNIIWQSVVNAIEKGGIFGYGTYGDRPFVFPYHFVAYSHNIFLELICSFGVIGFIISAFIIADSVYMIFVCKKTIWKELFIIFFSISCQLLLSMSFWYVFEFWAAAAIAHKYHQLNKRNELNVQK